MISFVWALAMCLFVTSVLLDSFSDSLTKTLDRLGADIIVVPQDFKKEAADALFLGELNSFSFDRVWLGDLSQIEGIAAMTTQTYLTSLAADCCSSPTQMIVFDPQSDFIIRPWLESEGLGLPGKGQLYIGHKIIPPEPDKITFFGQDFEVLGRLELTNTGFDTCVFMTSETAQEIIDSKHYIEAFGKPEQRVEDIVSSVMIKGKPGSDLKTVARRINHTVDGAPIRAYTTLDMFSNFSDSVRSLGNYSHLILGLLVLLVAFSLFSIFSITINERTKEFGILSILGVKQVSLATVIVLEAIFIGLSGSILGLLSAGAALSVFKIPLMQTLNIPRLNTSTSYYLSLGGRCLLLALAISLLASLRSAWRIARSDIVDLIQGSEL